MDDAEDEEEALIDAHTAIAALGLVSAIKIGLEAFAEELAREWLAEHHDSIAALKDDRQDVYRQIREMTADPLPVEIIPPHLWLEKTASRENGKEVDLPHYDQHLLCDEDRLFPQDFRSSWEPTVLKTELARPEAIGWYRNPARAGTDSLGAVYEDATENRIVRPDFIFFVKLEDGSLGADLIDPHGDYLADSLPKLQGLARYAAENLTIYRRIEAINRTKAGTFRALDLTRQEVRSAVEAATSAEALYTSPIASDYMT